MVPQEVHRRFIIGKVKGIFCELQTFSLASNAPFADMYGEDIAARLASAILGLGAEVRRRLIIRSKFTMITLGLRM
jgi:hypothetical protein